MKILIQRKPPNIIVKEMKQIFLRHLAYYLGGCVLLFSVVFSISHVNYVFDNSEISIVKHIHFYEIAALLFFVVMSGWLSCKYFSKWSIKMTKKYFLTSASFIFVLAIVGFVFLITGPNEFHLSLSKKIKEESTMVILRRCWMGFMCWFWYILIANPISIHLSKTLRENNL